MSTKTLARVVGDEKKTIMPNVREYYGQLIGTKVVEVLLAKQAEEDWTADEYTPILALKTADGDVLYVEVWSDAEGNGSGHLHIETLDRSTIND